MKKPGFIDQLVGIIYILLSVYFIKHAGDSPTPVDEFNIYWMFTISALGLGGFLLVTDSENKIIHWGSRVLMLACIVIQVQLVLTYDLGAAYYFPWVFVIFGNLLIIHAVMKEMAKKNPDILSNSIYRILSVVNHKKSVIFISRIFIGSLFVVSGLIKANDPLGFSYKLEEYFDENALGSFWSIFYDWSLFLSVFISSVEVLLGLAVLLGGKARLAGVTLLAMALFFAWLTWFTADCLDQHHLFMEENGKETLKVDEKFKSQYDKVAKDYEGYYEYIGDSDDNFTPEELVVIKECRAKIEALDKEKEKEIKALGEWTRICVDDCGCFGDAMKGSVGRSLTPWESFYKDICLLFFVIVFLLHSGEIKLNSVYDDLSILPVSLILIASFSGGLFDWQFPLYFTFGSIVIYWILKEYYIKFIGAEWTIAIVLFLLSLGFTLYCLWYLPIKDFRPYAIGNNLIEQRTSKQPELKFYYTLKDKKTGEEKEFDHWPEKWDEKYDFVSSRNVVIKEGVIAPAADFSISYKDKDGKDVEITDSVLKLDAFFLMVSYKVNEADGEILQMAGEFSKQCEKDGIPFISLTASPKHQQDSVIKELKLPYRFYSADEKVQKTIIRSNPGLLLIKKAVVTDMWPSALFPEYEDVKSEHLK